MENSYKVILFLALLITAQSVYCQSDKDFCKAVNHLKFGKVERIIKRQIKKKENGFVYYPETNGWVSRTSYYSNYAFLIEWLKKQDCVEDAFWDKCQVKEAIYPGHSTIGVRFKTNKGIIQKCFVVQEGTTGQVNIWGWRPHIHKYENTLVYKKMYDCDGFIEQQKHLCDRK